MKITESKGMRIHTALIKGKKKGENIINYTIHYKDESKWCNSMEDLVKEIKRISMVQLFGSDYKSWMIGKEGWRNNNELKENN